MRKTSCTHDIKLLEIRTANNEKLNISLHWFIDSAEVGPFDRCDYSRSFFQENQSYLYRFMFFYSRVLAKPSKQRFNFDRFYFRGPRIKITILIRPFYENIKFDRLVS